MSSSRNALARRQLLRLVFGSSAVLLAANCTAASIPPPTPARLLQRRWHLATSDRGVILTRRAWREQVERINQGLDPVGIVRGEAAEQMIHFPADNGAVTWDGGMRL